MSAPISAPSLDASSVEAFRSLVRREGERLYRDLPWRHIDDPYEVLVSEVMLQQTQVTRVLKFWPRFLERFPTVDALAAAPTAAVLESWRGLGYNRRALALKRACEFCSAHLGGLLPQDLEGLLSLDGVGPATAAGVMVFAYEKPAVYVETNVRTVYIHEFFPDEEKVPDRLITPLVKATCPSTHLRSWYYALLDYGAHLKRSVGNFSRRSASYHRQSPFEGSHRQKRSFVLQHVLDEPGLRFEELEERLVAEELKEGRGPVASEELERLLDELISEGFFHQEGDRYLP